MALHIAPDGEPRCFWCAGSPTMLAYHDTEWGFPVVDDNRLFEKIILEGFQSGLSWRTILNKREAFRSAFGGFAIGEVAAFGSADVERMLGDAGIVRHRGKIESAINNARRAQELIAEKGTLAAYVWGFEPRSDERPDRITEEVLMTMATSAASVALSKDLKKRGWSFVGPTTMYAFMQAMGLVNDHDESCAVRSRAERSRTELQRPRS
jgi:DNA-3-methyladenine glycosylase I